MPYRLNPDNALCVQQQTNDGWQTITCHDTQDESQAHLAALEINVEDASKHMTDTTNDKRIYFGSTVKALGNGKIEGMLIAFTDANMKDLEGEYFTKETNLYNDDYPVDKLGVLYQHGLDDTIGVKKIGRVLKAKIDDAGVWLQAQLDLADEYQKYIYQMAESGKLGWSSGALPQSVKVASDGHIKEWAVIEASVTPNPAMPYATRIQTAKSLQSVLTATAHKEPTGVKDANADNATNNDNIEHNESTKMTIDEMVAMLAQLSEAMTAYGGESGVSEDESMAMVEDVEKEMSEDYEKMDEEEMKSITPEQIAEKAFDLLNAKIEAKRKAGNAAKKAFNAKLEQARKNAPAPESNFMPAMTKNNPAKSNGMPHLEIRDITPYDNWTPADYSFALDMAQQSRFAQKPLITTKFIDKAFMNQFADKAVKAHKSGEMTLHKGAIKAVNAIKADELDYSTQAGFGAEWVFTSWSESIWDKPRLDLVYNALQTVEMPINPYEYPVESTDPTVFFVPETTDENQLGRNDSNAAIPDTKIATNKVQFNAKKHALRVNWSAELDEDAIGAYLPKFRAQSQRAVEDALELGVLLGDTSTSGNINLDGGTPGATSSYLAYDGIVHQALVSATTNALDGGGSAPTLSHIRSIRALLGNSQGYNPANLAIFTDFPTYMKLLSIDAVVTQDKFGGQATVTTGSLGQIDGINIYVSGQMALADADGKITDGGNVANRGRLAMVYLPDWYLGYRRRIASGLDYLRFADAWELVLTVRTALTARSYSSAGAQQSSDDSVALLYNIGV